MGLILFFVVCALVFLFYKVDKLSREIYSLELDIARLLRERTLDETFRESEGSEGSLKTGNVASANPAGSKSETLRPTNGGADGFADAVDADDHDDTLRLLRDHRLMGSVRLERQALGTVRLDKHKIRKLRQRAH